MSVQRYACGVEYDGGKFAGWQVQAKARTVEQTVLTALSQIADHPVELTVAGRTDAGVHALGQVFHFESGSQRSLRAWTFGANGALPRDVSLCFVRPVPGHFHARYSALARSYRYLVFNRRERPAVGAGGCSWQPRPLDLARMQQAAALLIGTHDFSAFRSAQCQSRSPIRHLEALTVLQRGPWIEITATANAFLHHMVRNLAGLLIDIGQRADPPTRAADVLASRDRRRSGPTAEAHALYLAEVRYPAVFALPTIRYDVAALTGR